MNIFNCLKRLKSSQDLTDSDREFERTTYIRLANYYYILGRYSFLKKFDNISGNLFHHAIEFYLKSALVKKGESEKTLRKINHNLRKLWKLYKKVNAKASSKHDRTIAELDKFEELRYPNRKGHLITVSVSPVKTTQGAGTASHLRQFNLSLDKIDSLVSEYYKLESINPCYYFQNIDPETRKVLTDYNKSPLIK